MKKNFKALVDQGFDGRNVEMQSTHTGYPKGNRFVCRFRMQLKSSFGDPLNFYRIMYLTFEKHGFSGIVPW